MTINNNQVWYNDDSTNGGSIITWYDADMDMYVTQDENNVLTYTSVAEFLSTDDSPFTDEEIAEIAASSAKNAAIATQGTSKKFKRTTRNIFALVNGKVLYLPDTVQFHAEMVRLHLELEDSAHGDDI